MKKTLLALCFASPCFGQDVLQTRFESSAGRQSTPYEEVIAFYKALDARFPTIHLGEAGPTDTRFPLHVVYYAKDAQFSPAKWRSGSGKTVILINNGIHPGEPDGIDASMMLLRDAALGKVNIPANVVLAVVPVFNIGGALNRGNYSRANQNGPEAYGFRGSAQNLDLNRDFTKMDALETQSLIRLFRSLDPDIFIDNHVSNGADYQHVMTLLSTQADKLGGSMGPYLRDSLEPAIYAGMKQKGYDLVPYVNSFEGTPETGWKGFLETPRFASGFAALFQTFSFVPETHMLKPYKQRVEATYALMQVFITYAGQKGNQLRLLRQKDRLASGIGASFPIQWQLDTARTSMIPFKGYAGGKKPSEVSGAPRLYYDRNKPFEMLVPVKDRYAAATTVKAPTAYVIQAGWTKVIDRLRAAGVTLVPLQKDSLVKLGVYRIRDYETVKRPYEGHYLHFNIQAAYGQEEVQLHKGDWWIPAAQDALRYLVETLEPEVPDGFFAWNFFDAVLQQKEHYSDYIFEDEAAALLKQDAQLRKAFDAAKAADTALANSGDAQLDWVYKHSPYYEPVHMRHPVFRLD